MKLLKGNGLILEVWNVDQMVMLLRRGTYPIKCPGWQFVTDEVAREMVREMMRWGAKGEKPARG